MHCLEVIVDRNLRAASREEAHALNDGDVARANAIAEAIEPDDYNSRECRAAFYSAYQEG